MTPSKFHKKNLPKYDGYDIFVLLILLRIFFPLIFLETKRDGGRGTERNIMWARHMVASRMHLTDTQEGLNLKPRYLGIKPSTLWCADQCCNYRATPARAAIHFWTYFKRKRRNLMIQPPFYITKISLANGLLLNHFVKWPILETS